MGPMWGMWQEVVGEWGVEFWRRGSRFFAAFGIWRGQFGGAV